MSNILQRAIAQVNVPMRPGDDPRGADGQAIYVQGYVDEAGHLALETVTPVGVAIDDLPTEDRAQVAATLRALADRVEAGPPATPAPAPEPAPEVKPEPPAPAELTPAPAPDGDPPAVDAPQERAPEAQPEEQAPNT